jgi:hypothetical protein
MVKKDSATGSLGKNSIFFAQTVEKVGKVVGI